ncbi:ABC transporter permease [Bacillus tropicus]|uniref:ABC transporter permease n=1 Tax=Bacillus tropicus TaxID=2026188 RepID=UPI003D21F966
MKKLKSELLFLKALFAVNLLSTMEYRFNFILQIFFMNINNFVYIVFWLLFFDKFQNLNGWTMSDMYILFSVVTTGFGLAMIFFGNAPQLANMISMGKLDSYLLLPRNVFLHILCSRMSVKAIGDLTFGVLILIVGGIQGFTSILLWMVSSCLVAVILVAFYALLGSLAFWLGKANIVQEQASNALLTFSMYPQTIYDHVTKFLMFTLIPAGFVGTLPVELMKDFNLTTFSFLVGFSILITCVSFTMFYLGLRKYESSNIFTFRD